MNSGFAEIPALRQHPRLSSSPGFQPELALNSDRRTHVCVIELHAWVPQWAREGRKQTMKGMLNFLEKAGLVRQDAPAAQDTPATTNIGGASDPADAAAPAGIVGQGGGAALKLEEIYACEGVPASAYPAERLLRVVDGLSAMDETTRNMAIKAIDAADESWTIADPLADATAKLKALEAHAERVQLNLQQLERETQGRLDGLRVRQEQVVGDIRKQMAELEALVSRELARGAQESAAQEVNLRSARDQAARELGELAQVTGRLRSLAAQFGSLNIPLQE